MAKTNTERWRKFKARKLSIGECHKCKQKAYSKWYCLDCLNKLSARRLKSSRMRREDLSCGVEWRKV